MHIKTINGLVKGLKISLLLIFFTLSVRIYGQDTYTISGKIYFENSKGDIFLNLVDEETNKKSMEGIKGKILEPSGEFVAFKFLDVPKGHYALKCFQDMNGNKKLDMGMFGPKEPWYLSWNKEKRFPPRWGDICFELAGDKIFKIKLE